MLIPRSYQLDAVSKARRALKKRQRALVVLATALGKTITSALVWRTFTSGRGLFLVHTNGILDNAIREYRKVFGEDSKFAVFNGRKKQIEGADVVFATFQSMTNALKRFPRNYFAWMTVDETHHAHAETYKAVVEHFTCPRLGITATPDRSDLLDIRTLFGNEVVNISLEEAIARGWLPKVEYHLLADRSLDQKTLKRIIAEAESKGRRISLEHINRRVFIRARDEKVASIIEGYNEKTVIFCRSIEHAEHFKSFLKNAETYHSYKSADANRQVLANLVNGVTRRVLAVNSFNEGIDVPDVGLVVFYRSTMSDTIFRQQLGRGMRPPKDKLVVLDFVGNLERVQRLKSMAETIANEYEKLTSPSQRADRGYVRNNFQISGKGFEFTFQDQIVNFAQAIETAIARLSSGDLYEGWQEAAEAARALGIRSKAEYNLRYRADNRLPSSAFLQKWKGFPGWKKFLATERKWYSAWQEASLAARNLGIRTSIEYYQRYKEDKRLPGTPHKAFKDFPGWNLFLGKASR